MPSSPATSRIIPIHGPDAAARAPIAHQPPPLSLYIHVPWCVRKCPYCDFNSHALEAGQPSLPEDEYLSALCTDLESALSLVWGRQVVSVFIGGGTPSLLSAAAVDRLLSDLRARLPLVPDCEITLEANPGTFEAGRFAAYRRAGVNRLSIGIQSFDDGRLQVLGRIHDRRQALQAVEIARGNFENFNLDLMYALPGQTLETARQDLETALQLRPPHLSLYQLTLEPNTVFARYPPRQLPDEDTAAAIQELIEKVTAEGGYEHYEVSAYAQPGHACRHNLNYWMFGDYLGIGAGAHGKLTVSGRILRQQRFRQPASYLAHARAGRFVAEERTVSTAELPFEFMLNALRLTGGFAPSLFAERTGLPLASIARVLDAAQARGLLEQDTVRIRPSELGRRFLNDLQAMFLTEP